MMKKPSGVSRHRLRFRDVYLYFVSHLAAVMPLNVCAQDVGPWGRALDWQNAQIDQVVTFGGAGQKVSIDGQDCLSAGTLYFKVNDAYAFDIDETVWLDADLYLEAADVKLNASHDSNDLLGAGKAKPVQLTGSSTGRRHKLSLPMERARFANLGFEGSDFSIAADDSLRKAFYSPSPTDARPPRQFTICNLSLRRSYTTPSRKVFGGIEIEVVDENGQPTPARMGLYDSSGRLPLPSDGAVVLENSLRGRTRVVDLGVGVPVWPGKNRSSFYSNGKYRSRLPAGEYELIVAKGMEYRLARQRLTVLPDETNKIKIRLQRWTDMAVKGWYSGDGHIKYPRRSTHDDQTLLTFFRAEDLRVANVVQIDNSANTYLAHHNWKPVASDHEASFVVVPGQEAPRTTRLGHTLQLNIKEPIRDTAHYLLYHKLFEKVRAQGGLTGYAHAVGPGFDPVTFEARGMAVDVPFGLVDFMEVMTLHMSGTSIWFDFLNLGYKISPTAGTEYPFGGVPGTVRNYVHVAQPFTPQAWFDGLKQGRTFVTSGPMLEVSANGYGVGAEIHLKRGEPLAIEAKASMNPDIGALASLELIEQGDAVKAITSQSGVPEMKLRHEVAARDGTWFVLRARGMNSDVIALSAPIYVSVDGQRFWKRSAVPAIAAKLKAQMREILNPNQLETTEAWETREPFAKYWLEQQEALKERVHQANAIYDDLVKLAMTEESERR